MADSAGDKKAILTRAEKDRVKFLRLQFTDILGVIKNVEVPDRQFEEALDGGIMFDPATKTFKRFNHPWPGGATYGVGADKDGNGWWAQMAQDAIVKGEVETGKSTQINLPPVMVGGISPEDRAFYDSVSDQGFNNPTLTSQGPRRMGTDKTANVLWVGNSFGASLARIDTRTMDTRIVPFPEPTMQPYHIAVDSRHNVWGNLWTSDRIAKYDPAANKWTVFDLPVRGTEIRHIALLEKDGKLQVWTHSQGVFPLRAELSRALRMKPADIVCTHAEGSGCYGHNGADDVAFDAALVARSLNGRPVKLQWMREDEFAWEPYGSAMLLKMHALLDESKQIVSWQHEIWSHSHNMRPTSNPDGIAFLGSWHLTDPARRPTPVNGPQPNGAADRNAVPLYDFPRQNVLLHFITDMPVRVSALRGLGAYANVFALESFMDEIALAAGEDPVAFRLKHMKNPRARAVIEMAAEKAGWKPNAKNYGAAPNIGRGIAFAQYKNLACYCAVVADVTVDRNGMAKVTRAVAAVDAGLIINPDGVINQIEGGIIQSASWTLKEQVKFDRQRITTRSWADYPIFTFNDVPQVEVHLINRPDERPLGAGEGSQGPTVAAIANAIANATGKRPRDLPFTPEKIRALIV